MTNPRLLHVDDNALILRALNRTLSAEGFDVCSVETAGEAEAAVREGGFDAMIVDLDLGPGIDGFELIERIRGVAPELVVLVLSGSIPSNVEARAEALGIARVLEKPAVLSEILEAVRYFTGSTGTIRREPPAGSQAVG